MALSLHGLAAVALLSLTPVAAGKEVLTRAVACGSSGCTVESRASALPFELLGPTIETGRAAAPRRAESPHLRVRLFTVPGAADAIAIDFYPRSGYLHVLGRRGSCTRICALVPRRWVALEPLEASAYAELTAGVRPAGESPAKPPPVETGSTAPAAPLVATAVALALGLLGALAWRRRRAAPAAR